MTSHLPPELSLPESGRPDARVALVLHGGGGPQTVAPLVGHLAASFRTLAPTHPGWNSTPRPVEIDSVAVLATAYLERLRGDGIRDAIVVGSSIGGWIALEMAVQAASNDAYAGLVGAVIDIDGVGAVVEGEPIADFFALDARALADVAWHDPARGYRDPAGLTDQQRSEQRSNGETMLVIAGREMSDPTLLGRLSTVAVPTLIVFGESDRVVTPAYGRAVSRAIPGGRFAEVPAAGHLPHLENPDATWAVIDPFLARALAGE
ncbi:alpha/beta hydrolase [Subtercola sp. Z020]|uniref:alpha/beta fold hydrolase n=1 Tax=Subtercola sp. Z020 TaxID=2080582 RepID=UPI000CE7EFCC|nr:alpha/beta hydrolase [Subtercola sp. Z020]PPF77333.1 alpha/beta hydrolase [Subtercola sp. Z020]